MKLSEAIRLGSMMKPQGFGWYEDDGRTCAMGAAYDAIGALRTGVMPWPIVEVTPATCPACAYTINGIPGKLYATGAIIVHLNDQHRWTREQIADFVETLELATDIQNPVPVLAEVGQ